MRCAKSLMLWWLQKMQEYWWYVEAFCKCPERKELVQIAGENHSIEVLLELQRLEEEIVGGKLADFLQ